LRKGDDIFSFSWTSITFDTEDSKDILTSPFPKVIIAGSGMSNGGSVMHHEHNYLPNPNNTILLVGYQSVGTIGRRIEDQARFYIFLFGDKIPVRARVEKSVVILDIKILTILLIS
jgi:metallo-beta-lactamase family protein